jgi:glyoxylase I family protein
MSFEIKRILHSSVLVRDTEAALDFYQGVLGLTCDESRPDLGYPGAWLKAGEQQIHLLELPNPDPVTGRPAHGGRDRHVALAVDNLDALQVKLENAGMEFTRSRSGRKALFTRDPDGNALEFIED